MIGVVLILIVMITACGPTTQGPVTAGSEDELVKFLSDNTRSSGGYGYWPGDMMFQTMEMGMVRSDAAVAVSARAPSSGGGQLKDYSTTNVQVEGIDEADIFKTDGAYIYTVTYRTLFIIDMESYAIVSQVEFDEMIAGLFLEDDRLVVFGNKENLSYEERMQGRTFVNIYDVSDRSDMVLIEEFEFEGRYSQGRLRDGEAFFVLVSQPDMMDPLPYFRVGAAEDRIAPGMIHILPIPYSRPAYASIHRIDVGSLDLLSSVVITEGMSEIYMGEHIYLLQNGYVDEWRIRNDIARDAVWDSLVAQDRELIDLIEQADPRVLSGYEKEMKIQQIIWNHVYVHELEEEVESKVKAELESYESMQYVSIVKIDPATLQVLSQAQVPGSIQNQFNADEHDGIFRIATTQWPRWWQDERSTNTVFTMDAALKRLDSVSVAPGESIYASRFMGDRLYLVTFRQIDPFFVIDLSDPRDIEVLGELKIPGYSRYLHPYDDDTIIGIGRDVSELGRDLALKISIFDVRDVYNPIERTTYTLERAYTSAEFEHKAFLFSREKDLLVLPVWNWNWNRNDPSGALVFSITPDEVLLRGLIEHDQQVERSAYIEDLLVTKSPGLLRVNDLEDLSGIARIPLVDSRLPIY